MKSDYILALFVVMLLIIGVYFFILNKPIDDNNGVINNTSNTTNNVTNTFACSDSDPTNDLFLVGSVTFNSTSKTDLCLDSTTLLQYTCVNNELSSDSVSCPSGYLCNNGACELQNITVVEECYDSDNGQLYEDTGVVTYNETSYLDYCTAPDELQEYYCDTNEMKVVTHTCTDGQECVDGHCEPIPTSCFDSDNGEDRSAKGTVTITQSGNPADVGTDECLNPTEVHEFYCDGVNPMDSVLSCEPGEACSNGKCVKTSQSATCEDPDGQDADVKGATTKSSESHDDVCVSPTRVEEFYCSGDNIVSKEIECQAGDSCVNGKCTSGQSPSCTDSDGGQDNYVFGTATDATGSHPDYCHSNGADVMEWYCDGNVAKEYQMMCQATGVCQNGACTQSSGGTCTETDGGNDEYVQGTTTDSTGSNTDYCTPFGGLIEYYCDNGQMKSTNALMCSYGSCQNGACPQQQQCTDSDGNDEYTYGYVTDATGDHYDYCYPSGAIDEQICDPTTGTWTTLQVGCTFGCQGGKCNTLQIQTCSDTDNGKDYPVTGTVTDLTSSYTDFCVTPNQLKEYYCDSPSGSKQEELVSCVCANGYCVI